MILDSALYEDGVRRPGYLPLDEAFEARRENAFVWMGMYEPNPDEFDHVKREFNLHELAVEDAIKAHQRPKLEVYGDSVFVVLKTARYLDEVEEVEFGEILIFMGDGFILTVRHGQASALAQVRQEAERRPDLLRCGPAAVLHAIVDRVVDDYQPVLEGIEDDIEEVEEQVFAPGRGNPSERIYKLKREVLEFHRAAAPLVEPVARLARGELEFVHEDIREYYRDVYDHVVRVVEQVDNFSELLTGALEANLSQITVRQNEDVRKISAVVAILATPTMIAGIYGMNFEHMPELTWTFGYPLILSVMAVVCFLLYRYFKRVGWL